MNNFGKLIPANIKNFVFLGESGSGKSEIAVNLAMDLARYFNKKVHFFDMDMTKPLFRSRDLDEEFNKAGIELHYEEQFMDSPTLVGGVNRLLKDQDSIVIMDVGGDYIGARSIGCFASKLNNENTVIYYVLNAMRPWSYDIEHIDGTLGQILKVSHINLTQIKLIDNSNNGVTTTSEEYLEASMRMMETVTPYMPIEFSCVNEDLYDDVKQDAKLPLISIHLYLTYEWLTE